MNSNALIEQITKEKGEATADAVRLASAGVAIGQMLVHSEIREDDRHRLLEVFSEFMALTMTQLVDAIGASHAEVQNYADQFIDLAKAEITDERSRFH